MRFTPLLILNLSHCRPSSLNSRSNPFNYWLNSHSCPEIAASHRFGPHRDGSLRTTVMMSSRMSPAQSSNRPDRLCDQTYLSAWLSAIIHRGGRRRHRITGARADLDEPAVDPRMPPLDLGQQWERQRLVHEALCQLDPRSRELLEALFLDPTSPTEKDIAKRLGIPLGAGPNWCPLRKKLEALLVEMGGELAV